MNSAAIEYAGFWRRLGAMLVDICLFLALTAPLLYLIYGAGYFQWLNKSAGVFSFYGFWDFIISKLLVFLLVPFIWTRFAATPGKILMHCEVVDAQHHQRLNYPRALLRFVAYLASSLPLNLGFLWIIWDKRKQGFHDKIAGTVVLYKQSDYSQQSLQQLMAEH